jgi:hypothetical protein
VARADDTRRNRVRDDIRARWADKLRNGGLEQGQGVLRNMREEYCCLGVLCEIAVEDNIIPPPSFSTSDGYYKYGAGQEGALLPTEVKDWAGLESHNPRVTTGWFSCVTLASLNDNDGATFNQIAAWIEGDPEL